MDEGMYEDGEDEEEGEEEDGEGFDSDSESFDEELAGGLDSDDEGEEESDGEDEGGEASSDVEESEGEDGDVDVSPGNSVEKGIRPTSTAAAIPTSDARKGPLGGGEGGKYVPPAMRGRTALEQPSSSGVDRRVTGLINRCVLVCLRVPHSRSLSAYIHAINTFRAYVLRNHSFPMHIILSLVNI